MPIDNLVFTETSPSSPGTVASSQLVQNSASWLPAGVAGPLDDYEGVEVVAELKGATGGTLDVYVQLCPSGGNWYDVIRFPQIPAAQAIAYYQAPLSLATNTSVPVKIGKNLAPALGTTSGAVVNGAWTDRIRLVIVAGTGTTLGAQIVVYVCPQRSRSRETGGQ